MKTNSLLLEFLNTELARRRSMNSRYSLRAYAKNLNVSSSLLSRILKGKVPLSEKMLVRFTIPLKLTQEQFLHFKSDIEEIHKDKKLNLLQDENLIHLSMEDLQDKISKLDSQAAAVANLTVTSFAIDSSLLPEIENRIKRFFEVAGQFHRKEEQGERSSV